MDKYRFAGYDKWTGMRRIVWVSASTSKHAKTLAYKTLTRPQFLDSLYRVASKPCSQPDHRRCM